MRNQTSLYLKKNDAGLAKDSETSLVVRLWHGAANAGGEYPFRPEHPHQRFPSAEALDSSRKKGLQRREGVSPEGLRFLRKRRTEQCQFPTV